LTQNGFIWARCANAATNGQQLSKACEKLLLTSAAAIAHNALDALAQRQKTGFCHLLIPPPWVLPKAKGWGLCARAVTYGMDIK
jgi:hypothetical protein